MSLQTISERVLVFKFAFPTAFIAGLAPGIYLINQTKGRMSSQYFTDIMAGSIALFFGLVLLGMVLQFTADHFANNG